MMTGTTIDVPSQVEDQLLFRLPNSSLPSIPEGVIGLYPLQPLTLRSHNILIQNSYHRGCGGSGLEQRKALSIKPVAYLSSERMSMDRTAEACHPGLGRFCYKFCLAFVYPMMGVASVEVV